MSTLPSPADWVSGNVLTAAELNLELRDSLKFLLNPPQVAAYHSTTQSIPNATTTPVALNSDRYDRVAGVSSTMHDIAVNNSRITPNAAGLYLVTGTVVFAAQATAVGLRLIQLWVNGTDIIGGLITPMGAAYNASPVYLPASPTIWEFDGVTDYVEVRVYQTSGVALNLLASSGFECDLRLVRVG